jgi:SAM-dependent methyltransferase
MTRVRDQYEAYPYPERDPADEAKRLIVGSPSHPLEVDHFLFGGKRDWSKPLRALFAGGGTGDGLIQMAAVMSAANRPYDFTYLDLSSASRQVAEARAAARGLGDITFVTGDLLTAPELGEFEYVDCCGVLHHLPQPSAGFAALAKAIAPGGGLGFMVYAPYGRSGVYPLQGAFNTLFGDLSPTDKLAAAKRVFDRLPSGHQFRQNPHLHDHEVSDAGFYDLLLHSQDQAMDVEKLTGLLDGAGLRLVDFTMPARYDLSRYAKPPEGTGREASMAVAEKLDGAMKTHVGYAALKGSDNKSGSGRDMSLIPHLRGVDPRKMAQHIQRTGQITVTLSSEKLDLPIPKAAAPIIAQINGQRSLAQIAGKAGLDPIRFGGIWGAADKALTGWGQLWYSSLLAGATAQP